LDREARVQRGSFSVSVTERRKREREREEEEGNFEGGKKAGGIYFQK
jgi:guanylate kinase